MHPFPRYDPARTQSLNGVWAFAFYDDIADPAAFEPGGRPTPDRIAVPGVFDACPAWAGRRGTGLYRTKVRITPGRSAELRFDGLGLWCRLFVDGQPLGVHDLPYSGWSVRVPPADHAERTIELLVDNRLDKTRTPLVEPYFDFYLYGGIYRGVVLRELGDSAMRAARVTTQDWRAGQVRIDLEAWDTPAEGATLRYAFDDHDWVEAEGLTWRDASATLEAAVPDARPWSPDAPSLHTLRLELDGDRFVTRFGLREVRVDGPRLLLNDQPLKLKGVCRHEAHPQTGPALPTSQLVDDLQLIASLGGNFVRGSHYPQDPRFLDLCDERGVLVFEESLGWQPQVEHFTSDRFVERIETQTRQMARASYNHPSVILWGFLNEGMTQFAESTPVYRRLVEALREEDATRPITFASNHPFDDVNLHLADVVSINMYPGWYSEAEAGSRPLDTIDPHIDRVLGRLQELRLDDRPFLISEIGAGALYGWRDPLKAHWSEEYQADLLGVVCRRVMEDPRILGVSLWQFCDGRTYCDSQALRRPRAFNNKGLFDEYRRAKAAVQTVSEIFGPQ